MIVDDGFRREYPTGAVRDTHIGKGRHDLMPLDVISEITNDSFFYLMNNFLETGNLDSLKTEARDFALKAFGDMETALLELAVHFEEGAIKYGEGNWRKGLEPKNYIDSTCRHYLKWKRGDTDERHDRAVMWNLLCCIWEVAYHEYEDA